MRLILFALFAALLAPFGNSHASSFYHIRDACLAANTGGRDAQAGLALKQRLKKVFGSDTVKVEALLYALQRACRTDLIDLTPTATYRGLLEILSTARQEYEGTGYLSPAVLRQLQDVGIHKQDVQSPQGKSIGWQLVIDAKAKTEMQIRSAATLASTGYLFVEALHQLSEFAELQGERKVFIDAIERTAKEILKYPDENGDGRIGWGRVWFKGRDGLLLHTSVPGQTMYFGGYTYFPRANAAGQPTCGQSLMLEEETFDHAHNVMFLLETFLVTRDLDLAKRILALVGKSFDDTFAGGAHHKRGQGWYYWKQLGEPRSSHLQECGVGREIKNTNLRMGLGLVTFAQILMRNQDQLKAHRDLDFDWSKYLERAKRVIAANNYEIFAANNFGYQGVHSRAVEVTQQPDIKRTVYDRTQKTVSLDAPLLKTLKTIIADGGQPSLGKLPTQAIICSGDITAPAIDRDVAGSCWNHLGFEAEDYFRIARFTNAWAPHQHVQMREYLDAIARNLAAAKIIHDGRDVAYAHYFPATRQTRVTNTVVNVTYYGFFCMAKKIAKHSASKMMPDSHEQFFESLSALCESVPKETPETGVTWRRGYKFYELYLAADRFDVPASDWLLKNKK